MRFAAFAATLLLAGCADEPTEWDRQLAAVRAGDAVEIVLHAGTVGPGDVREMTTGCGRLRRLSLLRTGRGPAVCDGADFTGALAAALPALPALERLDLDGPVRAADLTAVRPVPSLTHLNLPAADAGGPDLRAIAAAWPGLTSLRLHAPALTDADAAALPANLRHLHLVDAPLTDAAVPALASPGRLGSLYLDGSRLTAAGWAQLARLRPDLHLHADGGHF